MHAQRSHTQARTGKREPKRCGCAPAGPETPELCCIGRAPGRKGTSFWPRRAPAGCCRNCCVCVCRLLWRGRQDVAATPGSNGAAKAPKKKRTPPRRRRSSPRLAWSGLSPKLPEKRWRGERASASSAGPFRPCPPIMGPSVSLAGPDAQSSRSRPPGLSQSTRSPSARHHQSRTCRVPCARAPPEPLPTRSSCSRAATSRRRPKPLHSRIRLGAESFSGTGSRGPVAPAAVAPRASSVAVQVRPGRRGGCGSPTTRAVWRTNKRYRRRRRRYSIRSCCAPYAPSCALPHGSAKGTVTKQCNI
jgi:hypothetical protein